MNRMEEQPLDVPFFPEEPTPAGRTLAIVASRGTLNALVNVFTLAMAAAVSEMRVRIFLRDEAVYQLSQKRIQQIPLSEIYREVEPVMRRRLQEYALGDLQTLIRELKERGDVRLYACTSSMALCGLQEADLIPEIDEARGLTSFLLEEMSEADWVLSF